MSFQNIINSIKSTYKSEHDNLVEDFYNVVLSESIKYDRITGYFSSTSLAIAASGIYNFIKNQGHMRLLCGTTLNEDDLETILNSYDLKEKINNNFIEDIENIESEIIDNHVKLLGWMVENNLLEIKIGVKKDKTGYSNAGILHSKIGILYDNQENIITFDGSVNETANGWVNNIESFKVFSSINEEDIKFMTDDINDFDKYWNGMDDSLEVFNIPEASKQQLIKKAPKNQQELDEIILLTMKKPKKDKRRLFKHQQNAIDFWFENSKKSIFEMATGTGKTFTSLKCLEKLLDEENVLVVIATPQSHITLQWAKDLENMEIVNIYKIFSSVNSQWYSDLSKLIMRINYNIPFDKPNVIVTTHATFSNDKFIKQIKKANVKKCIIVDEMHHVGSEKLSKGLLNEYDYKLGLSATPNRFMDYEGTELILNYFNNNIYKFDISDALNEINPDTNKTFLTPYNYYPFNVELTYDEIEEYEYLTRLIGSLSNSSKEKDIKILESSIRQRRRIINNASNKYPVLIDILNQIEEKNHLIVFCSPQQIDKVLNILKEHHFSPRHRLTKDENAKPSKKYNGLSEREVILKNFDECEYKALVAIKCLDEGVDIPSANKVIILSSSTNPIEYVQRRGRVLRRYPGKELAEIYDLTIIPLENQEKYQSLIENEINRLYDFISNSSNKYDSIKKLEKWGFYHE